MSQGEHGVLNAASDKVLVVPPGDAQFHVLPVEAATVNGTHRSGKGGQHISRTEWGAFQRQRVKAGIHVSGRPSQHTAIPFTPGVVPKCCRVLTRPGEVHVAVIIITFMFITQSTAIWVVITIIAITAVRRGVSVAFLLGIASAPTPPASTLPSAQVSLRSLSLSLGVRLSIGGSLGSWVGIAVHVLFGVSVVDLVSFRVRSLNGLVRIHEPKRNARTNLVSEHLHVDSMGEGSVRRQATRGAHTTIEKNSSLNSFVISSRPMSAPLRDILQNRRLMSLCLVSHGAASPKKKTPKSSLSAASRQAPPWHHDGDSGTT